MSNYNVFGSCSICAEPCAYGGEGLCSKCHQHCDSSAFHRDFGPRQQAQWVRVLRKKNPSACPHVDIYIDELMREEDAAEVVGPAGSQREWKQHVARDLDLCRERLSDGDYGELLDWLRAEIATRMMGRRLE